jgi:hypothetical protein
LNEQDFRPLGQNREDRRTALAAELPIAQIPVLAVSLAVRVSNR